MQLVVVTLFENNTLLLMLFFGALEESMSFVLLRIYVARMLNFIDASFGDRFRFVERLDLFFELGCSFAHFFMGCRA